jgi:NapC/NirT cytochrome c family, N-terminal region
MTTDTDDRRRFFGRLFNYANNAITIAGVVLTTLSGLLIVVFLVAQLWGGLKSPYIGLFAYVVLPAVFVLGLLEIPIGMWRRRRRLIQEGATEEELTTFPKLDFNDPHLRRVAIVVVVMTGLNAVILGAASFFAVEEMETVSFCGETCHTVMQPEYTAYQDSPHSRVACVNCHIGPGASWFVKSKLDGLRQVWHTAVGDYQRPITTPLHTLRPARETCEQCHWPNKHHGDKLRIFSR